MNINRILAVTFVMLILGNVTFAENGNRMNADGFGASYFTPSKANAKLDNKKLANIRSFFSSNNTFFACVYRQDGFRSSFIDGEQYSVVKNEKTDKGVEIQISGNFAVADIGTIGRDRAFIDNTSINIGLVESKYIKRGYQNDKGFYNLGSYHTDPELLFEIGGKKVDIIAVSNIGLIGTIDGLVFELATDLSACKSEI